MMAESGKKLVAEVVNYFTKISVAIVELCDSLAKGDRIKGKKGEAPKVPALFLPEAANITYRPGPCPAFDDAQHLPLRQVSPATVPPNEREKRRLRGHAISDRNPYKSARRHTLRELPGTSTPLHVSHSTEREVIALVGAPNTGAPMVIEVMKDIKTTIVIR